MQISRHWRMKALRYRLEGVRTNTNVNESARAQHQTVEPRVEQQEAQTNQPAAVKRATAAR
jgi:hypothetical protein